MEIDQPGSMEWIKLDYRTKGKKCLIYFFSDSVKIIWKLINKTNAKKEKLLGIKTDSKLNFKDHIGLVYTKKPVPNSMLWPDARLHESWENKSNYECFYSSQFGNIILRGCFTV